MKVLVADSSLEAYRHLRREGGLETQQARLLGSMRAGRDYSLQELVAITGIQINAVAGRVNELKAAHRLEQAPVRRCTITGRSIHPVQLPVRQGDLFGEWC